MQKNKQWLVVILHLAGWVLFFTLQVLLHAEWRGRHCGWYPDKKVRLFDRTKGAWCGNRIHEQWVTYHTGAVIGTLEGGDLHHYSFSSVAAHLRKVVRYTDIMAAIKAENGGTIHPLKIGVGPFFTFLQAYVLKAGWLATRAIWSAKYRPMPAT